MIPACLVIVADFGIVLGVLLSNTRIILADLAIMAVACLWVLAAMFTGWLRHRLADAELATMRAREHEVRVMRQHKSFEMFT